MSGTILKILHGPPGTGKTWRAAREAVSILLPEVAPSEVMKAHTELVATGQIVWVTFHPSYTYEDFVEGYRPEVTEKGIMYVPRPGPFRIACTNVTKSAPPGQLFYVGQELSSTSGMKYRVITASPDSVMLRNIKGKGEGLETPVSLHIVERLRNLGFSPGELSLAGTKVNEKSEIAERVGVDRQTLFGMTGPLRAVWEHVESVSAPITERRHVVLVIDEINRADLSRVFGELITLLEADKRLGASEERQVMLPYSQTQFGVPAELHVIGTMNTADRSLSVMDAALRRRFLFEEVPPEPERCAFPYGGIDLRALLSSWNIAIVALASKGNQIGHAYFERESLNRTSEQYGYAQSEDGGLRTVAKVLRNSILPLLLDSFRGDWRSVEFILGRDFSKDKPGLFESRSLDDLIQRGGDVLDLEGAAVPELPEWWNPDSAVWDAGRLRNTLMQSST